MRGQGKDQRLITAAIARELLGFIWAIAQQIEPAQIEPAQSTPAKAT